MAELYIAGTFVGILLLLAAGHWINRKQHRHSERLRPDTPQQSDSGDSIAESLNRPIVWGALFIVVLTAVGLGTITVLTDPFGLELSPTTVITGLFGALFVGFISYNVYAVARNRGHSSAMSIGEALAVFALLAFAAVGALLVLG